MLCIRLISRSSEGYLADALIVDTSTDDGLVVAAIKFTSVAQAKQVVSRLRVGLEEADRLLDAPPGQDPAETLQGVTMWLAATFDSAADITC